MILAILAAAAVHSCADPASKCYVSTPDPKMRGKLTADEAQKQMDAAKTLPISPGTVIGGGVIDCSKIPGMCATWGLTTYDLYITPTYTGTFNFVNEDAICSALRFRALAQAFNPVGEITAKTRHGTLVCPADVNTPPHWADVKP